MLSSFPDLSTSRSRSATKKLTAGITGFALFFLAVLVYESITYFLLASENAHALAKIKKYEALVQDLSEDGQAEARYLAFQEKLAAFDSVLEEASPVRRVFNFFESNLDSDSALERMIYDTQKLQALVYIKSSNPSGLERAISPQENDALPVSILSKQKYEKEGFRMIYELRVPL